MMKKIILSLVLVFLFSGCLVDPQVSVKSVNVSGENAVVELNSNKALNSEVQLLNENEEILCKKEVFLVSGANSAEIKCNLILSKVKVRVLVDGVVFSKELDVKFDGGNLNSRIIKLAETTSEAELIAVMGKGFDNSSECTGQIYVNRMNQIFEKMNELYPGATQNPLEDLTQEEINSLQEQIDVIEECNVSVEKKISDKGNSRYSVNYSLRSEGECPGGVSFQEDIVIVEVNLSDNSAEVTKGSFSDSGLAEEETDSIIEVYTTMGSCLKAMMLGVNLISSVSTPEFPACTFSDDHLVVSSFTIEPSYAILHIKNNSEGEIELTGFSGSPVSLAYTNCCASLESGETTTVNVSGDFAEKGIGNSINEDITITYTLNEFDYSITGNCTGVIMDSFNEYQSSYEEIDENKVVKITATN